MRLICTIVVFLVFFSLNSFSQSPTQTVRGTVTDADNKQPLIGVAVIVPGSDPILGTTTNEKGEFRLEKIPVGRLQLQLTYTGYEKVLLSNLEVNSGKEVVLTVSMEESSIQTDEVVVTGEKNKR